MINISEELKNRIIDNSDIVSIIGEYVDLKKSGDSHVGLCPFHNEKTPSFTVSEKKQLFHCFGCGAGGDVVSFIMQKEGLDYPSAMKLLADKQGISLEENNNNSKQYQKNQRLYEINRDIMMFFYKNLLTSREAQNYLKKRGLKSKLVNTFMLGFAKNSWDDLLNYVKSKDYLLEDIEALGLIKRKQSGDYYDKYRNRIIFPIINHYGKVIGFGARSIDEQMPKYLNSPESEIFKKRYNLFGLNLFKKQNKRDVILVEGYMDVIGLNNYGIDIAVASLGTSLTNEQAKLISRYADNVYICYDSDNAGIKATDRAIGIFLQEEVRPKIISLGNGLDPDEFTKLNGKDEFIKKMDNAEDVYNYKYNKILDIYSKSKANEKIDKLSLFVEFLASIDSELTREIFINNVSTLFKIDKETLKSSIEQYNQVHRQKMGQTIIHREKPNQNKVIVEDYKKNISINELEILRLFCNQRGEYEDNKDFFDEVLEDKRVLQLKNYLEKNELNDNIYSTFPKDYQFIIDYIKNDLNEIVIEELMDRIEYENKLKKLKEIRNNSHF